MPKPVPGVPADLDPTDPNYMPPLGGDGNEPVPADAPAPADEPAAPEEPLSEEEQKARAAKLMQDSIDASYDTVKIDQKKNCPFRGNSSNSC